MTNVHIVVVEILIFIFGLVAGVVVEVWKVEVRTFPRLDNPQ
jgi:hypothetical protein